MARNVFGKTWWGKKWLDSMNEIDYSNRLPRGRSYASSGRVEKVSIEGNIISAIVNGSYDYNVELEFDVFSEEEKKLIIKTISDNPIILSDLLSGQMPNELYNVLEDEGIQLFPESWDEVEGYCDCPDWAVPCKHIAAVLYMVGKEIDFDPFLIFRIRGINIKEELKKIGYSFNKKSTSVDDFENHYIEHQKSKSLTNFEELENLDFSKIPDLRENILMLLDDKPIFYNQSDFKKILSKFYKGTSKIIKEITNNNEIFENHFSKSAKVKLIMFGPTLIIELIKNEKSSIYSTFNNTGLVEFLNSLSPKNILKYDKNIVILYYLYHFSLILMKQGAFIPRIMKFDKENHIIRWIPALMNKEARNIYDSLKDYLHFETIECYKRNTKFGCYLGVAKYLNELDYRFANNMIFNMLKKELEKNDIKINYINKRVNKNNFMDSFESMDQELKHLSTDIFLEKESDKMFIDKDEQINQIVNFFITSFNVTYNQSLYSRGSDKIDSMFFGSTVFEAQEIGEEGIPNSIKLWLSRLHLSRKKIIPLIKLEEIDNGIDVSILVKIKEQRFKEPIAYKEIISNIEYNEFKIEVLKDLNDLCIYYSKLRKIVNSKGEKNLNIEFEELSKFMFDILPILKILGIEIIMPKSLEKIIVPTASINLTKKSSDKNVVSYLNLEKMLDFNWKIALGDNRLSKEEFIELVKNSTGIVKIRDKYVYLDKNYLEKLFKQLEKPKLKKSDILKLGLTENFNSTKIEISEEAKRIFEELLQDEEIIIPKIKANLRDYQKRGFYWLYKNSKIGFGSIIADDMGLGKTLQIITLLTKLKEEKRLNKNKALIIVPTTLLTNWQKEIYKFSPLLHNHIYHGNKRELKVNENDVILTSYGIVRSDIELLKKHKWELVIIDEAQNIKNNETAQTKAIKSLKGNIKIAMTGTPVENRLTEYWSIFDYTNKGYLGSIKSFKENYSIPIEVFRNKEKLNEFKRTTSPFILRRLKSDKSIINDLPDKIEIDEYCTMTKEQSAIYQNIVNESIKKLESVEEGIERKGLVFKLMTSLKQACNHPSHFLKQKIYDIESSGKSKRLFELLDNIFNNNEKVLIFTQYKEMGEILAEMFKNRYSEEVLFLHGGVSRKKRDEFVNSFQNDSFIKGMILSLKAGGVGLNLTSATNVIHYDLWWNPAVENQATDRAFRIGQKKNVMVHRLITKGTFDEKIDKIIKDKKELADLTISKGEKWIGEFSNKELKELINLD